ncbi:MAG TPA: hypothetical protein VLI94_00590 [Solirubrobacterales bacterium]|nr:hypothetical protein [Solirubrobacterales bacterium]
MRLKLVPAVAAAALAISLLGATGATAATEIGNNCTGNRAEPPGSTLVQLSSVNPSSLAAPHDGVLTKWKVNVIPYPGGISEKVKVLRPAPGAPNTFTAVGESTLQPILGGANSFDTRIPVLAGDRIGAFSPMSTIWCMGTGSPANVMGVVAEDVAIGAAATFPPATDPEAQESLVAMSAVIEPDADKDGFGDETQDACPQSATSQAPCPVVSVSTSTQVRKGSVTVVVTPSTQATVTVKGVAKLAKGKKAKLNGGTQILAPGLLGKFRLGFTKALKNKLKELPPKRSVKLNVTISGTSVSGAVTTKTLKVKLKGQAKP